MTAVDFRLAVPDELPLVMDIVAEAAAWLTVTDRDYVAALYERIDQRVSSAVG